MKTGVILGVNEWQRDLGLNSCEQLHRVQHCASPVLARNERMSVFLRFVVERQISGREAELKECESLASRSSDRKPGFDPKQDSTVRTEAGRLRARLFEYYAGEGAGVALVIELPKGGYIPRFRQPKLTPPAIRGAPRPHRRAWRMAALFGLAVALVVTNWWRLEQSRSRIPIAVLPLTDLSQDHADGYFADGITTEIIRNLSIIDGIAVRSQTSSFTFKGKARNIREAGKQLGVDYILEGSILRAGQQLRINAQLIRVRDDFPLWSGRYDRELRDIFAIQDEVSRGIVNNLRLKLGRGHRRYETSVEAYDLYLRARSLQTRMDFVHTIDAFKESLTKVELSARLHEICPA